MRPSLPSHLCSRLGPFLIGLAFVWCFCRITDAQDDSASTEKSDQEYFETYVRPLLANRCYECHGKKTGPENGELVLETTEGIAQGGTRGALINRESAEASLLLTSISYLDESLQMPPNGKLPESEIEIVRRWLNQGASLPNYKPVDAPKWQGEAIDWNRARQHWAFRPFEDVTLPKVANPEWGKQPIDAFVLSKLEAHGLTPNPRADDRTLSRRLAFDLIGLPPSDDDGLARPESTQLDNTFEQWVDRYLASPGYGERWARNWLDLARYADFTPDWQSPTQQGWMYRDWVVHAWNDNLPYDRFVKLQVAADQLPDVSLDDLAALGFLGLGPTYWKELRLAPGVIEVIVADEWDERIDAVSRTFLGLTVACARCHQHKFDPITTEDYYALAGVFASTQVYEQPLIPQERAKEAVAARAKLTSLEAKRKEIQDKDSVEAKALAQQISELKGSHPDVELPFAHVVRDASVYVMPDGSDATKLVYREQEPRDLPVFRRGNPNNPGQVVPRRFLSLFVENDQSESFRQGSGRKELAESLIARSAPLLARVFVNRVWHYHFGSGLVRTPSDFGAQGDLPTHPELLEHLSAELVRRDWDVKWLHRQILLSNTWQQSSDHREDAYALDPDNKLMWRMSRRRLDFEPWRDALLSVTGRLNLRMGGPSAPVDAITNVRRSLYVTIDREELHPILRMHDFPEASSHSPSRIPTTTPLQQLFALNSSWMEAQSRAFRDQVCTAGTSIEERISHAIMRLFRRPPTTQEFALAKEYLSDVPQEPEAIARKWQELLHALLCLNEFCFVE
jgi:hypothetical protein